MDSERRWIWGLHYVLLGGIFVVAAVPKIYDPLRFAADLGAYGLLPGAAVTPAALLLPWMELCAGFALIAIPGFREAAAVVLMSLLLAFSGALVIVLVQGRIVSCGCFGAWLAILEKPSVALVRNAVLLGVGGSILIHLDARRAKGPSVNPGGSTPETALEPTRSRREEQPQS